MTLNQYKTVSMAIANKIAFLEGDPFRVKRLKFDIRQEVPTRMKTCGKTGLGITSGESNAIIKITSLSNPNNPNYKFKTLKPGSINAFYACEGAVDLSEYNFDTHQLKILLRAIDHATIAE